MRALRAAFVLAFAFVGAGAAFAEELGAIVGDVGRVELARLDARARAWLDAHAGDPQAPRVRLWLGRLWRDAKAPERAAPLFEAVMTEAPGSEWAAQADATLADVALVARRFDEAETRYERLARDPRPLTAELGRTGLAATHTARARFLGALAAGAGLALACLVRVVLTKRRGGSLLRPPAEVLYALPLPLGLGVAALGQVEPERSAVGILALGALVLLWLHGVHRRARPPRTGGAIALDAAVSVAESGALLYCAVAPTGLFDRLMETLGFGAPS